LKDPLARKLLKLVFCDVVKQYSQEGHVSIEDAQEAVIALINKSYVELRLDQPGEDPDTAMPLRMCNQ
jgi:hypothetical protein